MVLLFGSTLSVVGQEQKDIKEEVLGEMKTFYDQMRGVDLGWMDYLSDDATAVHNGEFLNHDTFVRLEKEFFNSLKKLEITVLTEPLVYVLGNEAASVTQEHSVNTWYKTGQEFKNVRQMMTFIWHKRDGQWKIVHSSFTTKD